jgi:hypothetical protein
MLATSDSPEEGKPDETESLAAMSHFVQRFASCATQILLRSSMMT